MILILTGDKRKAMKASTISPTGSCSFTIPNVESFLLNKQNRSHQLAFFPCISMISMIVYIQHFQHHK